MITTSNPSHEPAVDAGRWGLAAGCLTIALAIAAALLPVVDWGPTARVVGWLLFLAGLSAADRTAEAGRGDAARRWCRRRRSRSA